MDHEQRLDDVEQGVEHVRRILQGFDYARLTQRVRNLEQLAESLITVHVHEEALEPIDLHEIHYETCTVQDTNMNEESFGSIVTTQDEMQPSPTQLSAAPPNEMRAIDSIIEDMQHTLVAHIDAYNTKYTIVHKTFGQISAQLRAPEQPGVQDVQH